ncbi:hypothetical protein WR25_15830 [Diploscapter pachys]|uniref:Septin n=1 Tax=Diploscapter pachys TaxID=2018661 RepID=A0A2A2JR97_9BILA|nr:hypothetical protein WR25_15830 [Diploscapter pachys]
MSLNRSGRSDSDSTKEGRGYWGFANFQNQVFRRAVKSGFDFTLMVVGRGGLGKSTFINTLFLAEINDLNQTNVPHNTGSTTRIEEKFVKLIENGVNLNLTLVDTPGFGDHINNTKCWEPVLNYVESKFLTYFCDETKVERKEKPVDKCVHLCLYFIEPNGHGLKQIDIEFMRQLMGHVNIVPVIAKADCLTAEEMAKFKKQIRADVEKHELKLYQFPELTDGKDKVASDRLKSRLPFAVVGSNSVADGPNGRKTRFRKYPWGIVEVENLENNDFIPLRDIIIRTNLIGLIDVTRSVHYENFRFRQMEKLPQGKGDQDPFTLMEEERKRKERDLQDKRVKLENTFKEKITERENRIRLKTEKLDEKENQFKMEFESRRRELESLRHEVEEMRKGNFTDSKSSLNSQSSASHTSANENAPKTSPPVVGDKTRKKMATLSIFNRN